VNVSIRFAPVEPRKYSFQLPLKINKNSTDHVLTCRGIGAGLVVDFLPDLVKLGPILPYQSEPAESVVDVSNPTDYPIELYSMDYDTKVMTLSNQYSSIIPNFFYRLVYGRGRDTELCRWLRRWRVVASATSSWRTATRLYHRASCGKQTF
jgi:hypothetical protein